MSSVSCESADAVSRLVTCWRARDAKSLGILWVSDATSSHAPRWDEKWVRWYSSNNDKMMHYTLKQKDALSLWMPDENPGKSDWIWMGWRMARHWRTSVRSVSIEHLSNIWTRIICAWRVRRTGWGACVDFTTRWTWSFPSLSISKELRIAQPQRARIMGANVFSMLHWHFCLPLVLH